MKKYIIIVAGGKGLRMGGEVPKQFLPIQGKPVLMRTIEAFIQYDPHIAVILVLPSDHQNYWNELCQHYQFTLPYQLACGGETRFHSVRNGLKLVEQNSITGVHDGVRPFVSVEVISRCYQLAETHPAIVPVVPVYETIREIAGKKSITRNRNKYRLVQTPQVFSSNILKQAYEQEYNEQFTDDASVVEAMGIPVMLTEGNRENIKITTPFDIKIANALID